MIETESAIEKNVKQIIPSFVRTLMEKAFSIGKQIVSEEYQEEGFVHSYANKEIPNSYFEKIIQEELKEISKDSVILDLGSGKGETSQFLKKCGFSKVFSIDRSVAGLKMEKRDDSESLSAQSSAEKMPFPDNTFDFIHTKDVLQHIKDKELFFSEIARVLKPNGKVLATTSASEGFLPNYGFVIPFLIPGLMKKCGFADIRERKWIPKIKELAKDWMGFPVPRTVFVAILKKKI